jgi:hypothetical protein
VQAAIDYVCVVDTCHQGELFDLLQEMDRRYFLVQDLRWEFSLMDREQQDSITPEQARYETCVTLINCKLQNILYFLIL